MTGIQRINHYIGHCIYCGSTEQPLSDEHALPTGLHGNHVLVAASCEPHRRMTSFFEGKVLQGPLRYIREHYHILNRKRQNKRPPYLVYFMNPDGSVESRQVPKAEYPFFLLLPKLPISGILEVRDKYAGYPDICEGVQHSDKITDERIKTLQDSDRDGRLLCWPTETHNFAKFLAKVCYCFAICSLGERFEPLVLDLILSPRDEGKLGAYYVGDLYEASDWTYPPLEADGVGHIVKVRSQLVDGTYYIICRIRLFAWIPGLPVYDVVVGSIKELDLSLCIRDFAATQ